MTTSSTRPSRVQNEFHELKGRLTPSNIMFSLIMLLIGQGVLYILGWTGHWLFGRGWFLVVGLGTLGMGWVLRGLLSPQPPAKLTEAEIMERAEVKVLNRTVELDDVTFLMLTSPMSPDNQEWLKSTLAGFISQAGRVLGDDFRRGMVLMPDPNGGEYLEAVAWVGMPPETLEKRYYIGDDPLRRKERGVAGDAYLSGEIQINHMWKLVNGSWDGDHPAYIPNPPGHVVQYLSFAAIPIRRRSTEVWGVLCLDSMNRDLFDADDCKPLLSRLGKVLGYVLLAQGRPIDSPVELTALPPVEEAPGDHHRHPAGPPAITDEAQGQSRSAD